MSKIKITKPNQTKNLYVFCNGCKKIISSKREDAAEKVCGKTGKSIKSCPVGEQKHVFKAIVQIPNTLREKRCKVLPTKNISEAIIMVKEFEQNLEINGFGKPPVEEIKEKSIKPRLFVECASIYYLYQQDLKKDGSPLPEHKRKNLSKQHIEDWTRFTKMLCETLKVNGIKANKIGVSEVDDQIIGCLHAYLKDGQHRNPVSNKYYNRVMKYFSSFFDFLIENENYELKNPFSNVRHLKTKKKAAQSISKEEYQELLKAITPEKGIGQLGGKTQKTRNYYRDWIIPGVQLSLMMGTRREETLSIRFDQIEEDEQGNPIFIRVENLK